MNYLPIDNKILFIRGKKIFFKVLKYYNIGAIIIFDFKNQKFLLRRFLTTSCISITLNPKIKHKESSIFFKADKNFNNSFLAKYLLFLVILKLYKRF